MINRDKVLKLKYTDGICPPWTDLIFKSFNFVSAWVGSTDDDKSDLELIPEKATAPHSSTLAWKIPWTEEPGRLQSMGSLRVRHD